MNIKTENRSWDSLNESQLQTVPDQQVKKQQQFLLDPDSKINEDKVLTVLNVKSKQFKFENGGLMGKISIDLGCRFGLKWHFDNTSNLEEFLKSIETFIGNADITLTDLDKSNLTVEYSKGKKHV